MSKITIVTVVFNNVDTVESTINSCIGQIYTDIEYIVIDGKSTDGTVDIILKYLDKISVFISEVDCGIYDAMNKAIDESTGEWVLFMNSGDIFYDQYVVRDFVASLSNIDSKVDIIYGNTIYKFDSKYIKVIPGNLSMIRREMVFCHQSTFTRLELLKKSCFNLKYKYAADYNMFYQFYVQNFNFYYLDTYISIYNQDVNGTTSKNFKASTRERFSIHDDFGSLVNKFLMYKEMFVIMASRFKYLLLGKRISDSFFRYKYRNSIINKFDHEQ